MGNRGGNQAGDLTQKLDRATATPKDIQKTMRIKAFDAQTLPITQQARALLHELTVSVFWPHRESDLELLIAQGQGYIAVDEIGRPVGSAMRFPMGNDFATLGMMVTPPRLQAQGGGRWLLQQVMHDCDGRDLRLNATRSGYRLYLSAGFIHVGTVYQHQGSVGTVPQLDPMPGLELTPTTLEDRAAIAQMDAEAFGADRSLLLSALMGISEGLVASRNGRPCGYALLRPFGKGHVLGPLVAESEEMAVQIAAPLLKKCQGKFLRIDTPCQGQALSGFLTAAGMALFDTVTEMRIGPHRRASEGMVTFGLAAHSVG